MPISDAISYNPAAEGRRPVHHGRTAPTLQSHWRVSGGGVGLRVTVQLRGAVSEIMALSYGPGSIVFPTGISLATERKVICESAEVEGDGADTAVLTLVYRARNERETDSDVEAGLQSRVVAMRWVERQETIEHWASRRQPQEGEGEFNANLFQLWISESDPVLRADFKVRTSDDEQETYYADLSQENPDLDGLDGSTITKAVAQRYAMGVQYASNHMLQLEVAETWRRPPPVDARCNVRIPAIPPEHRPLGTLENFTGKFYFVRTADGTEPLAGGWFSRRVVYLCIPDSMTPANPPELWGTTPVDELLNPLFEAEA
ncbi:MAG: hypothetical protein IJ783_01675 [Kiritimatiellae bacterium]|nr:hypothetical protein [Kiritimatiellia bacterium]